MPISASELFEKIQRLPNIGEMSLKEKKKYLEKLEKENHPKVFEQFKKDCHEFFEDIDDTPK